MIEEGLQQRLAADADVAALLADRIYPVVWPSDAPDFPLLTYQLISTVGTSGLRGLQSVVTSRIQFDAWSKLYGQARTIAEAVWVCLQDFSGTLPDGTDVLNITLDGGNMAAYYDAPTSSHRISLDLLIQYQRP